MADFATHALLGAACYPEHPIAGAVFGLLPDLSLVPMNTYTLIRDRKLSTGEAWRLTPYWMQYLYRVMHGVFIPALMMFLFWFFIPPLFPLMLAYVSHTLIDAPLHNSTTIMWPVSNVMLIGYGKDWWSDWKIWVSTISISGLIVAIQQGLI